MEAHQSSLIKKSTILFSEEFELQFYKIFRPLKILGCDYCYFLGVHEGTRYRLCTHEEWIDYYYEEKLILNDPLKRIAENTQFIVLPWTQLTTIHNQEKRAMNGRISFGLNSGLTVAKEYNKKKYIFALATESTDHDLARYLLLEEIDQLNLFIQNSIRLFDHYLLLISKPISVVM